MTCCVSTARELKARVAEPIREQRGIDEEQFERHRFIYERDSGAFGRVLDRFAAKRGMMREDVAVGLQGRYYTADALEVACNGGFVGNLRDFTLALKDVLSLDRAELSELLYTYIIDERTRVGHPERGERWVGSSR